MQSNNVTGLISAGHIDDATHDTAGTCRMCGIAASGQPFYKWVRPTFTNYDELLDGDIICNACLFCTDEQSTLLAKMVGKDKPQRMRTYSHFVIDGKWRVLSKAHKSEMRDILLNQQPQVAIIATSGQKHIIFRARVGWWQIEEHSTLPFPDHLRHLLTIVDELYQGGFNKTAIETGQYMSQKAIGDFGLMRWHELESLLKPERGSFALELAVFLTQKEQDDGTIRTSHNASKSTVARDTAGLQAPVRPQHLEPVREQHQIGGIHEQDKPLRQLDLFQTFDNRSSD